MILDKIVKVKTIRLEKLKELKSLETIKKQLSKIESQNEFIFEKALKQDELAFICEVKKASPSKGIISEEFNYLEIAKEYEKSGANAISVLTEEDYFLGSSEYLIKIKECVKTPVLRKDFIIDEYQIYESKLIGADAILLICSILNIEQIKKYIEIADSLGLSALVEAHDEIEVKMAIEAGARIIGVNNRNLKTFEVDIQNSINLRGLVPDNIIYIAESGIRDAGDIGKLRENGIDGVLIGETLMRGGSIEELRRVRD